MSKAPPRGRDQLTAKQARFVEEYMVDMNAARAALRAGYNPHTAFRSGAENMHKPAIVAAIQAKQAVLQDKTAIRQDTVLEAFRRVAFSDLRAVMEWNNDRVILRDSKDLSDEVAAAVQSVKCRTITRKRLDEHGTPIEEREIVAELKLYDKLKALEALGKHLGLFVDRHRLEMDPAFLQDFVARVLSYVPNPDARSALLAHLQTAISAGASPGISAPDGNE